MQHELSDVESFLDVSNEPEHDLTVLGDARMRGTCEWFSNKGYFQRWSNSECKSPSILWMTGKPASGKSVLASYVINRLQSSKENCSFFLFKHGDRHKSRLSFCLRSLALQMSRANREIRAMFLRMNEQGTTLEMDDERDIWRKLFMDGIFRRQSPIQYWVIDALDECTSNGSPFVQLLARLDRPIPIRIMIWSRESVELEKPFLTLSIQQVQHEKISLMDTSGDIKSIVEERSKYIPLRSDADRAALTEKLIEKSEGSFLWAVLVLQELANAHSEKDLNQALEEIPREMNLLYRRILELMAVSPRGNVLAQGILTWASCAIRPLTTNELAGALSLDLEDCFPNLVESIQTLCGYLVTVDKFDRVKMVHATARDFLFEEDLESQFAVNKIDAHTRMARACLKYLNSDEMRPPRTGRRGSAGKAANKRARFSAYACTAFSYHLARASPLANDIMPLTEGFLKMNVLSWIELVAQTKHLVPLIDAAKNLKRYLNVCSVERSPLGDTMHVIRGWSTDLTRIAAKFGDALIALPSAIYALIPPFCPAESGISKIVFPGRKLSVVGLSNSYWDDRVYCVNYREGQASALCYGNEYLAVGRTTGTITLYDVKSCQEYTNFDHGEAVRFLEFQSRLSLMASGGIKTISVWDVGGNGKVYDFEGFGRLMGLFFDGSLLGAVSSEGCLMTWDLDGHGARQPDRLLIDEGQQAQAQVSRVPSAVSIAIAHKMLAIARNGRPISLWDLEETAYYGECGKKSSGGTTSTHAITALLFNPNPNIGLLAASYLDGELVVLDPFDDRELVKSRVNCHTLAASPDGRLLAGGAGGGCIQIYEFDSLDLLYRVSASNFFIKQLAYSTDNLHLADIRGSLCNIWEPANLLQDFKDEGSSQATMSSVIDVADPGPKAKISAILLHPTGDFAFCGKDTGLVTLYHLATGVEMRQLYSHKSAVHILTWWPERSSLMSVDASNKICAYALKRDKEDSWVSDDMIFQSRLDCGSSISQITIGDKVGKFIATTRESDHLWDRLGQEEDVQNRKNSTGMRRWMQHPRSPDHVISFEGPILRAHIHAWNDWSQVSTIALDVDSMALQVKISISFKSDRRTWILLELFRKDGSAQTGGLHIFEATKLDVEKQIGFPAGLGSPRSRDFAERNTQVEEVTAAMDEANLNMSLGKQLGLLTRDISRVIGISEDKHLFFLDSHSWVCSAELKALCKDLVFYRRHFFVPYEWFAGVREILCAVARHHIVLVRNDNLAIVKGSMEYSEHVYLREKSFG